MTNVSRSHVYGPASACTSLAETLQLIRSVSVPETRKLAAAHGMSLHAFQAIPSTEYFEDSRFVVDELSRAKVELDIASLHTAEVVSTTAAILGAAQAFLDHETVGCNEWPLPKEIVEVVFRKAREIASAEPSIPADAFGAAEQSR